MIVVSVPRVTSLSLGIIVVTYFHSLVFVGLDCTIRFDVAVHAK